MSNKHAIALIGLGAAGSALAAELNRRTDRPLIGFDADPSVGEAIARAGGIRYAGLAGSGSVSLRIVPSAAAAAQEAQLIIVTVTADRHAEVGRDLASSLQARHIVLLHSGYVGGSKIFVDAIAAAGCRQMPIVAETINSLHLSGTPAPGEVFIRGRKVWLEASAFEPSQIEQVIDKVRPFLPELTAGRSTLETGLNNPNPIGHVPALVGNLGVLGRELGDITSGVLQFDELRSPAVQLVCDALERERVSVVEGLGFRALPIADFSRRAYPEGSRLFAGVPRFGTKLLSRFWVEDVPAALVPLESLALGINLQTPLISALVTLCSTAAGIDFRATGRTAATLGDEWVIGERHRVGVKANHHTII